MSYKYSFADNEIYSANDLNAITKRLVTAGVEDSFSDGVAYNVSRFNEAGKLLYTSGVVPQTCRTLKVQSAGENKILINPGVAFFNDGSVIEVEAGGETLEFVIGLKNYVYLKNDLLNTNMCCPCCTTDEPSGDYVLLAEIDEEGNISDKRTYAKGKLPGYQSVAENTMRIKETVSVDIQSSIGGSQSISFDIGNNNYKKIMVITEPEGPELGAIGYYDIEKGKYFSFVATSGAQGYGACDASYSVGQLYISNYGGKYIVLVFSISDGVITVDVDVKAQGGLAVGSVEDVDIDLILF